MGNGVLQIQRPPEKLRFLFDDAFRSQYTYFILKGGRGGGKTETLGQFFVVNSFNDSGDILCIREIQNSISDSVYKVIVEWIEKLGVEQHFNILKTEIINKETGARFIFRGMKGTTESSSIKSLKGVKFVWYEEAQTATKPSIDMLLPTIRIEGCQFFFSMNPDSESDVVPTIIGAYSTCFTVKINYYDNQYCPQVLINQALECKELFPQEYDHIWEGKPRSDGDRQTVVTKELLYQCVDAHKELGHDDGFAYAGLDLAAGELKKNDKNALAIVKGCRVRLTEEWRSGDLSAVAQITNQYCEDYNVARLYYDAVGVGGFAGKQLMECNPEYAVEAYMGQHKAKGEDRAYIRTKGGKITNKDTFKNTKSQMWWNVRLRAENTLRMKRGFSNFRPEYYLSLDSNITKLDNLISEMSQATWAEDNSGRIIIDKSPCDYKVVIDNKTVTMRSPNRADSVVSAFLRSCRSGLKANR